MYRVRSSGEVKSQGEIRKLFPNKSLPRIFTEAVCDQLGIDLVLDSPAPEITRYQTADRSGVTQDINGNWVWAWVVGPIFTEYTDAENITHSVEDQEARYKQSIDDAKAIEVREERSKRLAETDWRFRSDMNPSQNWVDYCQALRDIPEQEGFPWDVVWPEQPE